VRAATGVESRIRRCGQPAHRFIVTDLVVAFPPDLAVPLWTFEEKSAPFPTRPLRGRPLLEIRVGYELIYDCPRQVSDRAKSSIASNAWDSHLGR
jgi:hypothetical protein